MQNSRFKRRAQQGFTLIELIVVIVILGIMAATAIPKFTDLGADARAAKLNAAAGAMKAAAANYHAAWIAKGSSTATTVITMEGTAISGDTLGYPAATTAGIIAAAGLTSPDYVLGAGSVNPDSSHATTTCQAAYSASTSGVSVTVTSSGC
ncbi:type II secretion system protein [Massilia sp. TS11]|uniref:type II secretion system protein n=1 Tax=Massilia sp. TS11 TaxID=2908003 RepID=UPI0022AA58FA|nr:type II secretion system protein [Massilia sp. TS11]